jgi:hypothetical protein
MGRRSDQLATSETSDWEEDESENMDDELELDLEAEDGDDDADDVPAAIIERRGGAWRLIEQASEQRMLRKSLEDFDDYVV